MLKLSPLLQHHSITREPSLRGMIDAGSLRSDASQVPSPTITRVTPDSTDAVMCHVRQDTVTARTAAE
jgi:hypothetical protein